MGDDFYDPGFTQDEMNTPNPNYPQPPFISHNQPSSPSKYTITFFSLIFFFSSVKREYVFFLVPYGDNSNVGNSEFFLHIDPKVKKDGTPDFKLSNCKFA